MTPARTLAGAGIAPVLAKLLAYDVWPPTRVAAMQCLACQVRNHAQSKNAARMNGVIPLLVTILKKSRRPRELNAAFDALGSLVEENRMNQVRITNLCLQPLGQMRGD